MESKGIQPALGPTENWPRKLAASALRLHCLLGWSLSEAATSAATGP